MIGRISARRYGRKRCGDSPPMVPIRRTNPGSPERCWLPVGRRKPPLMKKHRRRSSLPNPYQLVLRELGRSGAEYLVIGASGINYFAKDARQILSTADYDLFLKPTSEN